MLEWFGRIFAGFGAGMIIVALAGVTLLIGVLVTCMVALISGPVLDKVFKPRT